MQQVSLLISRHIRQLSSKWLAEGRIQSIRDIGDGLCEDFAEEAISRIRAADPQAHDLVRAAYTDDWWLRALDDQGNDLDEAICFEADIPRLRLEGAPLPSEIPDAELSLLIGSATHMWIMFDGKHYDATAPDGADHFLTMPFFADQISGYLADPERFNRQC